MQPASFSSFWAVAWLHALFKRNLVVFSEKKGCLPAPPPPPFPPSHPQTRPLQDSCVREEEQWSRAAFSSVRKVQRVLLLTTEVTRGKRVATVTRSVTFWERQSCFLLEKFSNYRVCLFVFLFVGILVCLFLVLFGFALPCLALPCLALPCLALPCFALLCFALPCLALFCFALP